MRLRSFPRSSTKRLRTPSGTLAYTDVGTGAPVVLLHGNPTSAYLYRHVIRAVSDTYRCIAPDYLGFGRSDAPPSFSYRPPAHATLIESLIARLGLNDLTLVLHDWGGPIGLSYALRHPDRIRRLILLNTWGWPLDRRPLIRWFSRIAGSPVGRRAIEDGNVFPRLIMPATAGPGPIPPPDWIQFYVDALNSRTRRHACWMFARSLLTDRAWLRALWTRRSRLRDHPALLCWGMRDPAFGTEAALARWQSMLPQADIHREPTVGHYVPEEMGPDLGALVRSFLDRTES